MPAAAGAAAQAGLAGAAGLDRDGLRRVDVLAVVVGVRLPAWAGWLAIIGFVGGFGILVTRLPRNARRTPATARSCSPGSRRPLSRPSPPHSDARSAPRVRPTLARSLTTSLEAAAPQSVA